jgi:hypothetical protein
MTRPGPNDGRPEHLAGVLLAWHVATNAPSIRRYLIASDVARQDTFFDLAATVMRSAQDRVRSRSPPALDLITSDIVFSGSL